MTLHSSVKEEEMFRGLVENFSEGVILLDPQWNVIYLNHAAQEILNKPKDDLAGRSIWDAFPGAVGSSFYLAYRQAQQTGKPAYVEDYSASLHRWIQATAFPSGQGLAVCFHDFTPRKLAEKKLVESEERFRTLVERITDGFIALDRNFCYTYVNRKIGELAKLDPESLVGRNVWEVFPGAIGSYTYKAFQTAMTEQRFISNMDYYEPLDLWQENYIYPSPDGLSVFIRDISERKKMEAQMLEQERSKQLQLVESSLEAQERERTIIGAELHDNVNQIVVATKVMLAHLRDNPEEARGIASHCITNLEKVLAENRRLAHELVTPALNDLSLLEEMSNLVTAMFSTGMARTRIHADGFREELLDDKKKLAAYRIAQEQFTNIVKHSEARNVDLSLSTNDEFFTMSIADDGKGADLSKLGRGIGLQNIEARVRVFDGSLRVRSEPGKGFIIEVMIAL